MMLQRNTLEPGAFVPNNYLKAMCCFGSFSDLERIQHVEKQYGEEVERKVSGTRQHHMNAADHERVKQKVDFEEQGCVCQSNPLTYGMFEKH